MEHVAVIFGGKFWLFTGRLNCPADNALAGHTRWLEISSVLNADRQTDSRTDESYVVHEI